MTEEPRATLVERLKERAASYRLGGPSSEHTAAMLEEAAAALSPVYVKEARTIVPASAAETVRAIAAWNRRATPAVRDGLVERLKERGLTKSRSAFDCANCGFEANLIDEVVDALEAAAALSLRPETRVKELE